MDGRDLEVVLRLAGGVRAEEETVDSIWFVWRSGRGVHSSIRRLCRGESTDDSLSGNHWHVRLGHDNAEVITTSYRYGEFFFLATTTID